MLAENSSKVSPIQELQDRDKDHMRVGAGGELCNLQPITALIIHNYLWFGQFLFGFLEILYSFSNFNEASWTREKFCWMYLLCLASRFDWFPSQIFYWYEILWIVNWIIAARRNRAARWSWARSGLTAPAQAARTGPGPALSSQSSDNHPVWESRVSTRVSVQRITYNQREDTRQVILTNWCHQSDQWIIREWELARGFQPGPVPTPEWFCLESWERAEWSSCDQRGARLSCQAGVNTDSEPPVTASCSASPVCLGSKCSGSSSQFLSRLLTVIGSMELVQFAVLLAVIFQGN